MITVLIIAVCYLVGLFLTRVVVLPLLLAKTKILHLMLEDKLTWSPYNVCDKFYSKLYNKPSVSIKNKNKLFLMEKNLFQQLLFYILYFSLYGFRSFVLNVLNCFLTKS